MKIILKLIDKILRKVFPGNGKRKVVGYLFFVVKIKEEVAVSRITHFPF